MTYIAGFVTFCFENFHENDFYNLCFQDIMSQLGELNSMWTDVQKDFIGK